MRGASRHKEVDGKEAIRAVENFRMIAKRTAGDCTSAYRDHNFRVGHRVVGLLEAKRMF